MRQSDAAPRELRTARGANWVLKDIFVISAANGTGTGELCDAVYNAFKKAKKKMPLALEEPATRLTFLGQPNVGKSSIINSLLGEERVVVSEFAGTTREPVDTFVLFDKHPFLLVDTVGIQRKSKSPLETRREAYARSDQNFRCHHDGPGRHARRPPRTNV